MSENKSPERALVETIADFIQNVDPYGFADNVDDVEQALATAEKQFSEPLVAPVLEALHTVQSYYSTGSPDELSDEERITNEAVKSISSEIQGFMKNKTVAQINAIDPEIAAQTAAFEDRELLEAIEASLDNKYGRQQLTKDLIKLKTENPDKADAINQAVENIAVYNQMYEEQQAERFFSRQECIEKAINSSYYSSHMGDALPYAKFGDFTVESHEDVDKGYHTKFQSVISMDVTHKETASRTAEPFAILTLDVDRREALLEFPEQTTAPIFTSEMAAVDNAYAEIFKKAYVDMVTMFPERFEEIDFSAAEVKEIDDDKNIILTFDEDELANLQSRIGFAITEGLIDAVNRGDDIVSDYKTVRDAYYDNKLSGDLFIDPDDDKNLYFTQEGIDCPIPMPLTSTERSDMKEFADKALGKEEPVMTPEKERAIKIDQIIGCEPELVYDLIESADFKLITNEDGTIDVYDNDRGEIAADNVTAPSVAVDALGIYGGDTLLDELAKDARNAGISNVPDTGEEWQNAVTRPDMQEFIEGHKTEVAEVLLIADPERMDRKVDLKDVADMFKEPTKEQDDIDF